MRFRVDHEDKETMARVGRLEINQKTVRTPIFWMGNQITGLPRTEELPEIKTVMLNAYEILSKKKILKAKEEGIHQFVNHNGLIMLDSGGFFFLKKDKLEIKPDDILNLYNDLEPDLGVVLDHPMDPTRSSQINHQRWLKTLKNTKFMLANHVSNSTEICLIPVIHGYSQKKIRNACKMIRKVTIPEIVGIGSLVPLMTDRGSKWIKSSNGKGARYFVIEAIKIVRKEFPDTLLHVFGVGGATTMHLMFSLGVDSVDSMSWRLKAAYGALQLPGVSDRFITPKNNGKGRKGLSEKEEKLLQKCKCPICRHKTLKKQKKALDNADPSSYQKRAIHNAFVFKEEAEIFRNSFSKGQTVRFIRKRLGRSPYKSLFEYSLTI